MNTKGLSKDLLFSAAAVLLFSVLLEGVLAFSHFRPLNDSFSLKVCGEILGEYDHDLFWRLKGVKPDFGKGSEKGKLKIMCLTDSVSVMYKGKGYPEILQEILADKIPGKKTIVFNAGVPGYTSFQGIKYFKNELLAYKPDIVITCYGWNDHWQSANKLPDKLQKAPSVNFIRKIAGNSRILGAVNSLAMKIGQNRYAGFGPAEYARVPPEDYRLNLSEFADVCKSSNILIVLMTSPYLDRKDEWVPLHKAYNSIVRQIAAQKNVPLIDLEDVFVKRDDFFIEPGIDRCHYNWQGSRIVAEAISELVAREFDSQIN